MTYIHNRTYSIQNKLRQLKLQLVHLQSFQNELHDGSIVESIIWSDTKMWKTARVQWHRLFISGLLMEQDSKKMFARVRDVGCL